jgi:hypothetical protein
MDVQTRLASYYLQSPFGVDGGAGKPTATVYAGPYLIEIPNTERRKYFIPYHDLHHIVTGYRNSRIGEGEIGAWELGTDCWQEPQAVLLNLAGMTTGLLYSPARIYRAFLRGCRCRNLYDVDVKQLLKMSIEQVEARVNGRQPEPLHALKSRSRFFGYFAQALLMVLPLLLLGYWRSRMQGYRVK